MGGEPLPAEHGSPLRLVVPGQYGMRSVKWLTRITAADEPFEGHFPRKYRYRGQSGVPEETPVGPIRVRSLITWPSDGARLSTAPVTMRGIAWSGECPIERVEVQLDGAWVAATLGEPLDGTGHVAWRLEWRLPAPGTSSVAVRATDAAGQLQPDRSVWNEGGYGNNVIHRISVTVG